MVKTSEHYIIPLTLLFINVIICSHLVFYLTHTLNVLASTAALEYWQMCGCFSADCSLSKCGWNEFYRFSIEVNVQQLQSICRIKESHFIIIYLFLEFYHSVLLILSTNCKRIQLLSLKHYLCSVFYAYE